MPRASASCLLLLLSLTAACGDVQPPPDSGTDLTPPSYQSPLACVGKAAPGLADHMLVGFAGDDTTYAPQAQVGLHASGWASGYDCITNTNTSLDVVAEGRKVGDFLAECGAGESDFVVVDIADRDAGYYATQGRNAWLDATNQTLPDFEQAFSWARAVSTQAQRPLLWWQIPVGNTGLPNSSGAWQDNRVEYFFAHLDELAATGAVGMAFGAGGGGQTSPETDHGYLAACAAALESAGGQPLCP